MTQGGTQLGVQVSIPVGIQVGMHPGILVVGRRRARDSQNEFWALKQMEGILKEPSPEDNILPEEVLDSDITIALRDTKVGSWTSRKANQYLSKLKEQGWRSWKRLCLTKNYDKSKNVHFDKLCKKKMTLMLIWHAKTWLSDSDNYVDIRKAYMFHTGPIIYPP